MDRRVRRQGYQAHMASAVEVDTRVVSTEGVNLKVRVFIWGVDRWIPYTIST